MTRVCGKRAWFHTAATDTLTAYHADASGRGLAAMTAFGILKAFTGVAVHDAYSAYYSDTLNQEGLTHALCVVHIQRELRGLVEHDLAAAKDGWAAGLDELIENLLCATRRAAVSPVQPGRTRREVCGSDGLPGYRKVMGTRACQQTGDRAQVSGAARREDPRDMAKA